MKFYGLPLIGQKTSDEWGTVSSPASWRRRWMTVTKHSIQAEIMFFRPLKRALGNQLYGLAFPFYFWELGMRFVGPACISHGWRENSEFNA